MPSDKCMIGDGEYSLNGHNYTPSVTKSDSVMTITVQVYCTRCGQVKDINTEPRHA